VPREARGYKCPRQIDLVDALPRTPTGKLFKKQLVTEYRERATA